MIEIEFVKNYAEARQVLMDAGLKWNAENFDTKEDLARFTLSGNLIAVYDGRLNMIFYEVKT